MRVYLIQRIKLNFYQIFYSGLSTFFALFIFLGCQKNQTDFNQSKVKNTDISQLENFRNKKIQWFGKYYDKSEWTHFDRNINAINFKYTVVRDKKMVNENTPTEYLNYNISISIKNDTDHKELMTVHVHDLNLISKTQTITFQTQDLLKKTQIISIQTQNNTQLYFGLNCHDMDCHLINCGFLLDDNSQQIYQYGIDDIFQLKRSESTNDFIFHQAGYFKKSYYHFYQYHHEYRSDLNQIRRPIDDIEKRITETQTKYLNMFPENIQNKISNIDNIVETMYLKIDRNLIEDGNIEWH